MDHHAYIAWFVYEFISILLMEDSLDGIRQYSIWIFFSSHVYFLSISGISILKLLSSETILLVNLYNKNIFLGFSWKGKG